MKFSKSIVMLLGLSAVFGCSDSSVTNKQYESLKKERDDYKNKYIEIQKKYDDERLKGSEEVSKEIKRYFPDSFGNSKLIEFLDSYSRNYLTNDDTEAIFTELEINNIKPSDKQIIGYMVNEFWGQQTSLGVKNRPINLWFYSGGLSRKGSIGEDFKRDLYRFTLSQKFTALERNPKNLKSLYSNYKNILFNTLSSYNYKERGFEKYVNQLINSYEHMKNTPNSNDILDNISRDKCYLEDSNYHCYGQYNTLISPTLKSNLSRTDESYEEYIKWKTDYYSEHFNSLKANKEDTSIKQAIDKKNPTLKEWYLSRPAIEVLGFWQRRHIENNAEAVYEILKDIQAHYKA